MIEMSVVSRELLSEKYDLKTLCQKTVIPPVVKARTSGHRVIILGSRGEYFGRKYC